MREYVLEESRWPAGMSGPLRDSLRRIIAGLRGTPEILGLAAGGSFITGRMDGYSDLDLVLAVAPSEWDRTMGRRKEIAASLGPLLASFTAEHVGEPRLLICLFGPPPVHVDLKFMTPEMLAKRVEDPAILWDRSGEMAEALKRGAAAYPQPSLPWIEERFWAWVHYECAKIGRGELFEALDGLTFLRNVVLGPLALQKAGAQPTGVRHLEQEAPEFAAKLKDTVARCDARDMLRALGAVIGLYRGLGGGAPQASPAEQAVLRYMEEVAAGL